MRIKINSANKVMYSCYICGKKLSKYDYSKADDMCSGCRGSQYRSTVGFKNKDGTNNIDDILLRRRKRG